MALTNTGRVKIVVSGARGPGLNSADVATFDEKIAEATTQAGNSAASAGQAQAAQQETEEALAAANITAITQPDGSSSWGIEDALGQTQMRALPDGEILLRGGRRLNDTLDQALTASNSISFVAQPEGSPAQRFEDRIGQSLYLNGERPARTAPLPNGLTLTDQWRYNDQVAADPITPQPIPIITSSNTFWPVWMRGTTSHVRIGAVAASPTMALFGAEGRIGGPNDDRPNRVLVRPLSVPALAAIDTTKDYTAALQALPPQYELLKDPNEATSSHTFVDFMPIYDSVADRWWVLTCHKATKTIIGVYTDSAFAAWRGASGAGLALPIAPADAVQMPQLGETATLSPTHGITTREGLTVFAFRRQVSGISGMNLVVAAFNRTTNQFEIKLEVPGNDPRLFGGVDEVTIAQAPKSGDLIINSRRNGLDENGVPKANRIVIRLSADGSTLLDSYIDETLVDIQASAGMLTFSSSKDGQPDRILFSNNQSNNTAMDAGSRYGLGIKANYDDGVKGTPYRGKGPIWPLYDVAYRDALGAFGYNTSVRRGTGYSDLMKIDAERFGVFHEGANMFAGRNEAAWHHSIVLTIQNLRSILA